MSMATSRNYRRSIEDVLKENSLFRDQISRQREIITELEEQNRWIPVEERLPEDGIVVLVMNDRVGIKSIAISRRDVGYWNNVRFETTHWMPLPAPPEERGVGDHYDKWFEMYDKEIKKWQNARTT